LTLNRPRGQTHWEIADEERQRMSWTMGIALYFIIWWIMLFAVLPFGVRTQGDAGERVHGTPESAPAAYRAKRIILINTAVATVVFGLVWLALRYRLIPLDMAASPAG
jgi:predicted secreted protein